jgi:cation transport ATPase
VPQLGEAVQLPMQRLGDLLLLSNNLRAVVTAIGLSRATLRKIRQNLFWAFIYNSLLRRYGRASL